MFRHVTIRDPRSVEDRYVSVPAIDTRGTWKVVDMIDDRTLAELALLYSVLNKGKGW